MNTESNPTVQSTAEMQNPPTTTYASEETVNTTADTTYYYAVLDDNDIVTEVMDSPFPAPESYTNYILIDSLDETLVGKLYDRETGEFVEAPTFTCDTDDVSYNNTTTSLKTKLDAMDAVAEANTAARHTHANQEVLDGITAEKVAAWDAGTGGSGVAGADGVTFTPSVSATGDLSWTNNGGLENPATVNIMGPQGPQGIQGETGATGPQGEVGAAGTNGITPHIGTNGNWYIGETDTGVAAQGPAGANGADGTSITATELLDLLKTVDGQNSGMDADMLDGHDASYFATATQLSGKADSGHSHSEYAASNHSHSEYASSSHNHSGTYAPYSHSHSEYADVNHTHSGYAASSHSHSDYFEKTGGTISGETNFSGGLVRVKGVQSLYHSGSQMVISSTSLPTRICGSAISATKTITVDSDERLKKDVEELDRERLIKFLKNVRLVAFHYTKEDNNAQKHIGVLAQELLAIDEEVAKYFVFKTEDGYYSVDYTALSLLAVLALQ